MAQRDEWPARALGQGLLAEGQRHVPHRKSILGVDARLGAYRFGRRHCGGTIFWFPGGHGDRRAASGRNTRPQVDVSGDVPVDVHGLRRLQANGIDNEREVTLACALSTHQVHGARRLR